ncbi:hypothetical protein AnigIFM60653_001885 [Aspergillus niger]|nr:hypothetical protein AnigIFM60653_001885 [Aspergillus niger]
MMEYPGEQKPDYRSPTQFGGSMDEGDSNDSALSLLDEKREKRLIRKIDLHIIPFVVLLYLFSFLDRVNIGNARLYGMEEDLGLVGDQYQVAVSILFVTYCLFEVPSNLVIKKLRPSRYIATISVLWGIIATLTGITQNYGGLIACRILLGVVEAGLFPGMVTYLTIFYSKREIALRTGYLFSSAAAAGAFGGLLAYGIGFMDGVAGLRGWRWIMIIEGIPTVILGVLSWFFLADDLDTAYYLDDEEKALVVRLRRRDVGQTSSAQKFHWADVKEGALDWRIYAFCIAQFGVDTMLYGYSTFLPTIIQGMGSWSTPEVQALTIPCYAVGAISYLIIAWASDRTQRRGVFTCIFAAISVVGYGILISDSSSGVHYFGALLIALGLYVAVGLPLAWLPTTLPRYGKRTFATGLQLTFGNTLAKPSELESDSQPVNDTLPRLMRRQSSGGYTDSGRYMVEQVYIPAIAERLLVDEDSRELDGMQEMCDFGTTVRARGPKCDVFTREDRKRFEFGRDLVHYYRGGPGPYAGATGWLNATANLLREGSKVGTMFLIL